MKEKKRSGIKSWAADDRPREKLILHGASVLSDAELIAILLAKGTRQHSAVDLARIILNSAGNDMDRLARMSLQELQKVNGVGPAKAVSLMAALELGRRRKKGLERVVETVGSSKMAADILFPLLQDLNHEAFCVLYLNLNNMVVHKEMISKGGLSATVVDVRLVIKTALDHLASALIIAHNHPSGSLKPSQSDKEMTEKLKNAAKLMDIRLLDHIIIAGRKYFSFLDERIL